VTAFLLFTTPIILCGMGSIFAAQTALEFQDSIRDILVVLLMAVTIVIEDRFGPSRFERR
jgi:hypothetical protein